MSWIAIIQGVLKIAGFFIDEAQKRNAMDEATERVLARQVVALGDRLAIVRKVKRDVEAMDDAAVLAELSRGGGLRDEGAVAESSLRPGDKK